MVGNQLVNLDVHMSTTRATEHRSTICSSPFFTLLCVARVYREDAAHDYQDATDADGKVACGWQWEPNAE